MLKKAFQARTKPKTTKEKILYLKSGSFCMPAKVSKNIFCKKLIKQKKKIATSKTEKGLIFIMYNKLTNNMRGLSNRKIEQGIRIDKSLKIQKANKHMKR